MKMRISLTSQSSCKDEVIHGLHKLYNILQNSAKLMLYQTIRQCPEGLKTNLLKRICFSKYTNTEHGLTLSCLYRMFHSHL